MLRSARALVRRPPRAHAHARLRQLATKIFDGPLKAHHRERAALAPDFSNYSYLHEEVARRLLDRLDDIHESYEFSDAVDLSCGPGHVRRLLDGRGVQRLLEFDSSGAMLALSASDAAGPNPPEFEVTQVQLRVGEELEDYADCASLCLAAPRLGLQLLRALPRFKEPLFAVCLECLLWRRQTAAP